MAVTSAGRELTEDGSSRILILVAPDFAGCSGSILLSFLSFSIPLAADSRAPLAGDPLAAASCAPFILALELTEGCEAGAGPTIRF